MKPPRSWRARSFAYSFEASPLTLLRNLQGFGNLGGLQRCLRKAQGLVSYKLNHLKACNPL